MDCVWVAGKADGDMEKSSGSLVCFATMTPMQSTLPSEMFCLPTGYRQRDIAWTHDQIRQGEPYWAEWRISESAKYQHYVYMWAASLIRRHDLRSVLDVGCGVGTKLAKWISPVCGDITGLDQAGALDIARRRVPNATFLERDLESPLGGLPTKFDLIMCVDVIEHLMNPAPVMELLHRSSHSGTYLLISTPERRRERGRLCMESSKPEHVREWADDEFAAYLSKCGFRVLRQRFVPKADAPIMPGRSGERAFRAGAADRSPWACQAVLCVPERAREMDHA